LAELNALDAKVQQLFAEFKPAYDSLLSLLRPGFPELANVIWEDLDRHCGMGKLRMDLTLADFDYTSLPTAPDVLKATTKVASQNSKGLKANYILKKFASNEDFYREMEAMRVAQSNGVHHPNVGEVEFAFEEGYGASALYYLAMPWYLCESRTWFKHQLEAKNASAVIRALVEMADGLSCLHHNGVIHGDLKPENLMFDVDQPTGRPKWIDFDFAGVDPKTLAVLKLKTAVVGVSLGFAPPEFFDGSTENRTRESDVYSLGQTFAALLGMPDPALDALSPKGKSTQGKVSREVLGSATYDALCELCRLMTQPAPEKRVSLSQSSQVGGRSVLERLSELYSNLTEYE
jgi:serine/threonine protein kinase